MSLTEDRERTDRFLETNFGCGFFEILLVSPVSLKNLLALTQERQRKINVTFLQKELLNKNSTSMVGLDDLKSLCQS